MTRTALINGCEVDIPVRQRDIDRILDDNCHNYLAVANYAAGLAEYMPTIRAEHEEQRPNLLFNYLQRQFAAQEAAALLNPRKAVAA